MAPKTKFSLMMLVGYLVLWSAATMRCDDQEKTTKAAMPIGARSLDLEAFFNGLHGGGSSEGSSSESPGLFNLALPDLFGLGAKKEAKREEALSNPIQKKEEIREDLFDLKNPGEFLLLLLNPLELIDRIVVTFKLDKNEFFKVLSEQVQIGFEIALQPALLSVKITEKVFVPDTCKLKFICDLAKPVAILKGKKVPKLSPGFLDGANSIKALTDGLSGRQCDLLYPCTESSPKLKKEYLDLKKQSYRNDEKAADQEQYAASSNQRSVSIEGDK